MNKKTTITLIVCVLAIAVTVYFLFWYDGNKKAKAAEVNPDGTKTDTKKSQPVDYPTFPLESGDKGDEVGNLQRKMNEWMQYNWFTLINKPAHESLVVDRVFGPKTLEFVRIIFGTDTVTETQYNQFMAETITPKSLTLFGF